jgi:hypothetical protein
MRDSRDAINPDGTKKLQDTRAGLGEGRFRSERLGA